MNLFGSARWLIDKTKNGENVPSLEVVEVDNQYQKSLKYYTLLPQINLLVIYQMLNQLILFVKCWTK